MGKIAFVYPGQGSQKQGMGKDFYEQCPCSRQIYQMADEILDISVTDLCFTENELLDNTAYTQPALVTTCLAMTAELAQHELFPDVTAGLSLGEYAAIAAAGGMSYEDAIRTVRARGIYMEEAVPDRTGTMAAVLGLGKEEILSVLKDYPQVSVANYNCPGQIVVTGETQEVLQAMEQLKQAGAKRCIQLNVSGPFHSSFLKGAGEKLQTYMEDVKMTKLQIPYVTNVTAQYVQDAEDIKPLLVQQVSSSVLWEQSVENMIQQGVDVFVEVGPGKTLSGFIKKIDRNVQVFHIGSVEDIGELECYMKK